MARVIAVCNQKGGVAKTTTAIALATGLSKRGYKVLMIDTDPQCNTTTVFRAEVDGVATIHDLLFTKGIDPSICIQRTEIGEIIASDDLIENDDANLKGIRESLLLRKKIAPFLQKYDFIVMDHNPGYGGVLDNVLNAANDLIIPMETEGFSIDGAAKLANRINGIKEITNPGLRVAGVLITKCNKQTNSTKAFLEQSDVIGEVFESKVFSTYIRRCHQLSLANDNHISIFDYDSRCNGAIDYDNLIDEYLRGVNNYGIE